MLTDPKEIEIISRARQKNVQDPNRSRQHFVHIFEDFFRGTGFSDKVFLDMGPGQYDFGVLARERGAREIFGVDNDAAVLELGDYKGFSILEGRIQDIRLDWFPEAFDGVFCKFSLNCFWFINDVQWQIKFVDRVAELVKPTGWAWIAPWNGIPKSSTLSAAEHEAILARQASRFKAHGYSAVDLTPKLARRYGVSGAVANNALFVKHLAIDAVRSCSSL